MSHAHRMAAPCLRQVGSSNGAAYRPYGFTRSLLDDEQGLDQSKGFDLPHQCDSRSGSSVPCGGGSTVGLRESRAAIFDAWPWVFQIERQFLVLRVVVIAHEDGRGSAMCTRSADWSVSIADWRNADGDIVAHKYLAAEAMNRVNRGFIEREGSATTWLRSRRRLAERNTRLDH